MNSTFRCPQRLVSRSAAEISVSSSLRGEMRQRLRNRTLPSQGVLSGVGRNRSVSTPWPTTLHFSGPRGKLSLDTVTKRSTHRLADFSLRSAELWAYHITVGTRNSRRSVSYTHLTLPT